MRSLVMYDVYYQTNTCIYNNTQIFILHPLQHYPYNPINVNRLTPLAPFTANAARELNVLGHDGDPFRMDGAQICILEQTDEIGLRSMLQGEDSG